MTWDPTLEPGYFGRIRASQLTGADGTLVASVPVEGTALNLTQTDANFQPELRTDANGRRFLWFDGVDDKIDQENIVGLLNAAPGSTMYAVLRAVTYSTTSFHYISYVSTNAGTTSTRHHIRVDDQQFSSGGRRLDSDAYAGAKSSTSNLVPAGVYVHTGNADYQNARIYSWHDGREVINSSFQTAGLTSPTDPLRWHVGGGNNSGYLGMELYELLIFEATHTAEQRAHVHSYIQDTYGVAVTDYVAATATVPSATLTGSWAFTGSATGKRSPKASTSGSWNYAGSATGKRSPKASLTGSWNYVGSATGKRSPKVSTSGSWTFTGSATGKRSPKASVIGSWSYAGSATGKRSPKASTSGSWAFTGSAVGNTPGGPPSAILTGSWAFTGSATGKRSPKASTSGSWAFTGSAVGKRSPKASTSGSWAFIGSATGATPTGVPTASLIGSWVFVGAAVGRTPGTSVPRDLRVIVKGPYSRPVMGYGPNSTPRTVQGPLARHIGTTGPRS